MFLGINYNNSFIPIHEETRPMSLNEALCDLFKMLKIKLDHHSVIRINYTGPNEC